MPYLINLMNFKKVTGVAIGVGIAACSVAEPAQAGLVRTSGNSIDLLHKYLKCHVDRSETSREIPSAKGTR